MRATNACSLRATFSAIITATSWADFTMSTFSATSRVIAPPAEFRRRLRRRLLRADDLSVRRDGARFQRLEGDVRCHQLGQRCREPWGIGILGVQDGAVIGLEDEGGGGGSDRRSHPDRSDEEAKARASQHRSCSLIQSTP
jgi:hypothetical protein